MTPRLAVRQDAAQVAALWNGMIRDTLWTFTTEPKSNAEVERLIDTRPDAFWVVSETPGHIDGFATFGAFRPGPGYAHSVEHTVVIRPEVCRRGLGVQLMHSAQAAAISAGHHVMIGALSAVNTRAIDFHKRIGFQQVALMPQVGRKAGHWLDLILMQKILNLR